MNSQQFSGILPSRGIFQVFCFFLYFFYILLTSPLYNKSHPVQFSLNIHYGN